MESAQARTAFVNSGVLLAEQHGFDGVDIAWQFPKIKPKKIRSSWGKNLNISEYYNEKVVIFFFCHFYYFYIFISLNNT